MQHVFVFVVCGAKEHIDTLNFSLPYLRHFSNNPIWVVTDSKRNEGNIAHTDVIDFETPAHYNNHQASILLKTGLHRILPPGNQYCYLDTDVIALSKEVDDIFMQFVAPITFAPDHCNMNAFSSTAIKCNCFNKYWLAQERILEVERQLTIKYDKNFTITNREGQLKLLARLAKIEQQWAVKVWDTLRYYTSGRKFKLDGFTYHKADKYWTDENDEVVLYDLGEMVKKLIDSEKKEAWDDTDNEWLWPDGKVDTATCTHLQQRILEDFSINVADNNWQHWNGGVFLFNDSSRAFLEAWYQKCLQIFEHPEWKTRDQGTLIATAWEYGLQNHPTLSKKWNFLADVNNTKLTFDPSTGKISDNGGETTYHPALIHIYHDFGKKGWPVWDWVAQRI